MRIKMRGVVAGILWVLLCGLAAVQAQDSTPDATPAVKWTFAAQARLVSSPAIGGDTVYVGSDDHRLYALDLVTGQERWAFEAGNMILGSPVVADNVVYIGSDDRYLYALNADDGTVIWSFKADGWVNSPLLANGTIYIGIDCTPENCADFNDIVFGLYAIDAQTGALKWKHETDTSITSQAAAGDGVIYAADLDGTVYKLSDETGESLWEIKAGAPVASTLTALLLDNKTLYVGTQTGRFYALDASSGQETWHFDTGDWVYSPPAIDGATLYLGSADGNLYALDREKGTEIWRRKIGTEIGNPVLHAGLLYFGSFDSHVYAFDPAVHKIVWSYKTDSYVLGRTSFTDDAIIFPSADGHVYALQLPQTVFSKRDALMLNGSNPAQQFAKRFLNVASNVEAAHRFQTTSNVSSTGIQLPAGSQSNPTTSTVNLVSINSDQSERIQ